ncbi:MAG: hypothetical protein ABIS35_14820 [Terracoccus sp.]
MSSISSGAVLRMRLVARVAVSLLLVAAGLLMAAASWQRWWPACRLGDFDALACIPLQDHLYDFILPTDPWVPIGNAAQLSAVGLLVWAFALALVPLLVPGSRPGRLTRVLSAVMGVGVAMMAAFTWVSGQAGRAVTVDWLHPVIAGLLILWPVAMVVATVPPHLRAPGPPNRWLLVTVGLLVGSAPLPSYFVVPVIVGYASHDSTPWEEAVVGLMLVAAALTWWPGTRTSREPQLETTADPDELLAPSRS